jgi:hypothetical protein
MENIVMSVATEVLRLFSLPAGLYSAYVSSLLVLHT